MKVKELTKAKLWCLDDDGWSFEFPFNPEFGTMELTRTVSWKSSGGGYDPWGGTLEYDEGEADELTFTILLDQTSMGEPDPADALGFEAALLSALSSLLSDETNEESVLPQLQKLWQLTVPVETAAHTETHYDVRPPLVAFVWEEFEFTGAITSLESEMLLFNAAGMPKRAKVTITMKGQAFSGTTTLEDFEAGTYTPPTASGSSTRDASRASLLDDM